jgi:hypothetical protein
MAAFDRQLSGMCANITAENAGVQCSRDGNKIVVTKQLSNGEGYSFNSDNGFPYIKYSVEVRSLPSFSSSGEGAPGLGGSDPSSMLGSQKEVTFADAASSASAPLLSSYGVKITYTVKMPGKIKKAVGGEIKDNAAEFDVLQLLGDQQNPRVESEELNTPYVIAAAAAGIVVLALIVYFLFFRKKPPQAPAQAPPSPPVQAEYTPPATEQLAY